MSLSTEQTGADVSGETRSGVVALWRIGVEAPNYPSDDLSGKGAERSGGRWNDAGVPLVYTSTSIALATLETLVHLTGAFPVPMNRYLVRIDVPTDVWFARYAEASPVGWDAEPVGITSTAFGTRWQQDGASLLAQVPSVIVPEEFNVLINPMHPDATRLRAVKIRQWRYDQRYWVAH